MAIAKKPNRNLADVGKPDPERSQTKPDPEPAKRKRKEPVLIRFDEHTLEQIDRAAVKRGLSRAALVRMLVIENLPD